MLPSRSVLLLLILKICKNKINFKQVNKNPLIPVTSKKIKHRYMSFQKCTLDFLKSNPHAALFLLLEAPFTTLIVNKKTRHLI